MIVLAAADLHITCLKRLLKDNAYIRAEKALLSLSHLIWEVHPDVIIICGDIFNSPYPTRDEIYLFTQFLLPLLQAEINVIIIPGNHDSDREGGKTAVTFLEPFDESIENFYIASRDFRLIEINNVAFYVWPWGRLPHKHHILDTDCDIRVGVSHITLSNTIISKRGHRLRKGYSVKSLKDTMKEFELDYMFLGDIHEYQKIIPNAFYPGSFYQTKFNESEKKGVCVLDTEENKVSFHILSDVPKLLNISDKEISKVNGEDFYTVSVNSKEKYFELTKKDLPNNVVRIDYPFGKITTDRVVESNRKIGYKVSIPLIMLKLLKKQGVKDLSGTIKYLLNMVDSKSDLILP